MKTALDKKSAISLKNPMRESFILNQIRKYNQARRQSLKDAALTAVGIHVGLIKKKQIIMRELLPEERSRILYFLREFLKRQGLEVVLDE